MLQLPLQSDPRQRGGRSSRGTGEPVTADSCRKCIREMRLRCPAVGASAPWERDRRAEAGAPLAAPPIGARDDGPAPNHNASAIAAAAPSQVCRFGTRCDEARRRGRGCGPRNSARAGLGRRPKGSGRRGGRRPPVETDRVNPAVRAVRYRLRRCGPCAAGRSRGRLELLPAGTDTMNSGRTRHERPNFAHRGWGSILMERHCR